MNQAYDKLATALKKRADEHLLREAKRPAGNIDFASNDYLGLAKEMVSFNAPLGAGSSRLISGYSNQQAELEQQLAQVYAGETATLFNSGYEANSGLFDMLTAQGIHILYDEHIHASIRQALVGARVQTWAFKHNDVSDLAEKLGRIKTPVAVVTEGLFSMNGTCAPLKAICALKSTYDFMLIVDEAHSTGILGDGLLGRTGEEGVVEEVDIRIHTFGKALGSQGACIVGNTIVKSALLNFCKPLIYSTAPSPLFIKGIKEAHTLFFQSAVAARKNLDSNIAYFRERIASHSGFQQGLQGPIQWWNGTGLQHTLSTAAVLQKDGFDVVAIRPPTVPTGKEGIRICLHAFNNRIEIDELIMSFVEEHNVS